MKKLLLILLFLPMIGFGQTTYVPDDNFELYLEVNSMGDGILSNDSVLTGNINTVTQLNVYNQNISDLTGIEDFNSLQTLFCGSNQLTTLDVSQNTALIVLYCGDNQLTSLDVSNNTAVTDLRCTNNQLAVLDLRNHSLIGLFINTTGNTQLFCIDVDSVLIAQVMSANIDSWTNFSSNCATAFGCIDSLACNYDSLATIDDSSCVYPVIWQQAFSICDGDSVVIYDGNTLMTISVYYTIGNYIDTLTAGNGCDSIIYTNVSIMPPIIWQQTYLICDGDSIVVGSSVYDTTGSYTDTLSSINGCDSIVHTYIAVDQNTSSYDTLSINASIVWNGMTLTVSGDYSVTVTNSVGCDSIVNLNLAINPTGLLNITNTEKTLFKVTDVLGRETKNKALLYNYHHGTVEKRITIE